MINTAAAFRFHGTAQG